MNQSEKSNNKLTPISQCNDAIVLRECINELLTLLDRIDYVSVNSDTHLDFSNSVTLLLNNRWDTGLLAWSESGELSFNINNVCIRQPLSVKSGVISEEQLELIDG